MWRTSCGRTASNRIPTCASSRKTICARSPSLGWPLIGARQGDYFDLSTYPKLGIRLEDIDAFFNYPDGNEHKLAAFLSEHGRPGAFLVVLTPEHGLELAGLVREEELAIERGPGVPEFRLVLYRIHRTAGE